MSQERESLVIMEILLTAEIFNQNKDLQIGDLPSVFWGMIPLTSQERPSLTLTTGLLKKVLHFPESEMVVTTHPFIIQEGGQRLRILALDPAAHWFYREAGVAVIEKNPVLASYFEKIYPESISYQRSRSSHPDFHDSRRYLESKISHALCEEQRLREALDLVIIHAPEEIEEYIDDLVYTEKQRESIEKIQKAVISRDLLNRLRVYDIGKILLIGPPGTGKTSLAMALSKTLHMPLLEVRLSMITSQYLGETSKNIERIFELAKEISPSILFIDEFDSVAKSRSLDDNGAMKRAVNCLVKCTDNVSLIKNGVLVIAATNHPHILDEAVWRRFDEVIEFVLPDEEMRLTILTRLTKKITSRREMGEVAKRSVGFSGSDLKLLVKEAILSALMDEREEILDEDYSKAILVIRNRTFIKNSFISEIQ